MRRKALSLLLAAAMVFSMNAVSFAAETTETVETQAVQKESEDYTFTNDGNGNWVVIPKDVISKVAEAQKANNAAQSTNANNGSFSTNAYKSTKTLGLDFSGINKFSVVAATGSKIKNSDIWDKNAGYSWANRGFYVSANGYKVGFKSVKITSKGQKAGDVVKFKFNGILPAKNVLKMDDSSVTLSEAKKAYKDLKTAFKAIKNTEYESVVCPKYISRAVSADYVNAIVKAAKKKQVSEDAISGQGPTVPNEQYNLRSSVVVTLKNGSVKKVQIPVFTGVKSTSRGEGAKYSNGSKTGAEKDSFFKVSYKTLKKNKDYTLSGNTVVLDPSTTYVYFDDEIKNFEVK